MPSGVKELKLWQESVALAGDVVRIVRQAARRETKVFTDHLLLAAAAIPAEVADGYASEEAVEQRRRYRAARRALSEVETYLAVARHAELLPAATVAQLAGRAATVARLLAGSLSYVERQLAAPLAPAALPSAEVKSAVG